MKPFQVIDFRARLRIPELFKAWSPKPEKCFEKYVELYKMHCRLGYQSVEETIEEMELAGVDSCVLCSSNVRQNEVIDNLINKYPNKFVGFAGVMPNEIGVDEAYKQLKYAFDNYNLRGVNLGPYLMNIYSNDKKLYPLYALCDEYNKIAIIHSSIHYNTQTPLELGNPKYLDEIAVDFPNLKIVMSHSGVGFAPTPLAIAQRHENIYLEVSGLYPKYVNPMFMHAFNTYLKHKVMFATDYPLVPFDVVDQWKDYIRHENWDLFFYENALEILQNT